MLKPPGTGISRYRLPTVISGKTNKKDWGTDKLGEQREEDNVSGLVWLFRQFCNANGFSDEDPLTKTDFASRNHKENSSAGHKSQAA